METIAGRGISVSIGWTGLALLVGVFLLGYLVGSLRSRSESLKELIKRIEERKTVEKLNEVADRLHSLVTGQNAETLDRINRLFGRLVILDRTGTAVAFMLAGLGVAAGIVASATSGWIAHGSGSFSGGALLRGGAIAGIALVGVTSVFGLFRLLYRRSKEVQQITKTDDAMVRAAIGLLRVAARSGAADQA